MIKRNLALLVLLSLGLTACTDRMSSVESKMETIRSNPAQPIKPPPAPEQVDDFVYGASDARSPFIPPSLLNMQAQLPQVSDIKPDLKRPREPLEEFELSTLAYRGLVVSPDGTTHALIERPDGLIDSVKVGQYLGTNFGQVKEITPSQINLVEIVSDPRVGFVERAQSLVLP